MNLFVFETQYISRTKFKLFVDNVTHYDLAKLQENDLETFELNRV